jgi:hypothetical protein
LEEVNKMERNAGKILFSIDEVKRNAGGKMLEFEIFMKGFLDTLTGSLAFVDVLRLYLITETCLRSNYDPFQSVTAVSLTPSTRSTLPSSRLSVKA